MKVLTIAEIGINHNGDMALAKKMVAAAKDAGADVAKFQWYDPVKILGRKSPHLAEATRAQFEENQHWELKEYCDSVGIEYAVSLFHVEQVYLVPRMIKRFKVASRAALDTQLLNAIAQTGKPVILSTGLCDTKRIKEIVSLFGKGYPLTLLYCECLYPCDTTDINLQKMDELKKYGYPVGFSSHCPYATPTLESVMYGASVVENHIVLDADQIGCDVSSSMPIDRYKNMLEYLRKMEPRHAVRAR